MKRSSEPFLAANVANGSSKLASIDESFIVRNIELGLELRSS